MAAITATMVKELREITGAGMMDCKKALVETGGDQGKAIDYLREKGIAKAAKKAGRIAAEGVTAAFVSDDARLGALVEINCETDFVANTPRFVELAKAIARQVAEVNPADLDALNASKLADGKTVAEFIVESIAGIGEKIAIRRFVRYATEGRATAYIHMGGKIGVLVDLTGGEAQLGKDIAMQIAASRPTCVDRSGVRPEELQHEREVLRAQALEEGKPEKIVDKMVEGRLSKFYKETCLVEQPFVKDPEQAVSQVLGDVKVTRFTRYQMGEGIEKRHDDFAAEVMAQVK